MANKNFEIKNGLTIAGTERISSSGAFTGSLASATTATTQSSSDNSTKIATTAYTDAAITAVIGGAPGTLDTLNELAAAINDDASYATTLTTALATKLPLAGGTLTGPLTVSPSTGTAKISFTSQGAGSEVFSVNGQIPGVNNTGFAIRNETDSRNDFILDGSGNATFSGDVTTSYGFQAGYFKIGSTVIVNANRDLTNIGTISSGAITSTGSSTFTSTGVMDINLVANPPELNFEDTSSTSGTKRARWTLDDSKFSAQGLSDDDQSLSHDFINLDLSSGSIITPKGGADNVHLGENAALTLGSTANYNTAIGKDALKLNATGSSAVAIGYQALMADQSVEESTAVGAFALTSQTSGRNHAFGFRALQDLTGGVYNTAVGGETLENVVNGGYNTAVGTFAGRFNQNGDHNCLFGYKAGYDINGGDANVAVGYEAFQNATTGNFNVAIGKQAMSSAAVTGDFNIAIGRTCLQQVTSGTQNLAIGVDSLTTMNTGNYNVALGPSALRLGGGALSNNTAVGAQSGRNTTSNNNAFFGYYSGYANTSGINTAIGHRALYTNQAGTGNVAVGNDTMYYNNGGSYNVAMGNAANQAGSGDRNVHIGQQAGGYNTGTLITAIGNQAAEGISGNTNAGSYGTYIGAYAGREINTGQSNTFIGYNAGGAMTTGSNNTFLGSYNGQTNLDLRTSSKNVVISDGTGTILMHTVVTTGLVNGNIDVTQNAASGNHITIAQGAVVNLFGSGNNFSGVFIINDFTSSGRVAMVMTGGAMIDIIYQSGGGSTFSIGSSPASGSIGLYLDSLGVKVKNNRGVALNFRVLSFRTRNQQ